jgi:urea transport system substrate-binding protein
LRAEGDATKTIITEQLRWSGGYLLGASTLDMDGDLAASMMSITALVKSAFAAQTIGASGLRVVIIASLQGGLGQNELLSAMVTNSMTDANGYQVLTVGYSEADAWAFQCGPNSAAASGLKVYSSSAYFNSVSTPANLAFAASYSLTYNVPNPIFTELSVSAYTAVKILGAAVSAAGSNDATRVSMFARSVTVTAPQGAIRMNLNQHTSLHTRIGVVSFSALNASIPITFESHRVRKSHTWHPYIASSFGFDCDWSDSTRGSKYKIDYVRVGILHSVTGALAFSERSVVDAELLAIDEINDAGGVLGKTILPVFYDGATDWPRFAAKAALLCAEPDITSVFGCWTSVSRKYVLPVFEAADKLLWYPVQYEGQECSNNVFYLGATPNQQIEPSIDWLFRNKPQMTDYFLVGSDYVFPRTANQVIKAYLSTLSKSTRVLGEMYIPLTGISYAEISAQADIILSAILNVMPNGGVIYNTLNGDSNIVWFRKMQALGMTPDKFPTMSVSIAETEIDAIGRQYMVGHYASWDYFQSVGSSGTTSGSIDDPSVAPSANAVFVASFKGNHGNDRVTNDPMEAGYIAVQIWKQAAEQAGVIDVTKLRAAAYGQVFDAPEGLVTMNSNHHLSKFVRVGRVNADGQFDIVSGVDQPVKPQPWNAYVNSTSGHTCDWSAQKEFFLYPAIKLAILAGFASPNTLAQRAGLDAVALAVQQANLDPLLPGYTLDTAVLDDAGLASQAEANFRLALLDDSITAIILLSPSSHTLLARPPSDSFAALLKSSKKLITTTRASSAGASSCNEMHIRAGATLSQMVGPPLQHLVEQGRSQFVLLVPDSTIVSNLGLQLVPEEVKAYIQANLTSTILDVVSIAAGATLASVTLQVRALLAAHPSKATILNFLPAPQSALFFQSMYDASISSAAYPVLSFGLDISDVRAMVDGSPAGQLLFSGHSFAASWTLEPGARDAQDVLLSIQEQHGATSVVTSDMDSAYSAVSMWAAAVRKSGSLDADRVRQYAYLVGSNAAQKSSPASNALRENNAVGKYTHIAKLGRNAAFQVLWPTNGAALFIEPDLSASVGQCEFGRKEVTLSFSGLLKGVIFAVAGLVGLVCLGCMFITHRYQYTPIIKHISPVFCLLTQLALLMLVTAGIIFAIEPSSSNGICLARIWIPSLCISALCSFLFAKMWRLHAMSVSHASGAAQKLFAENDELTLLLSLHMSLCFSFNNAKMQAVTITNSRLLRQCAIVNAPLVALLILWSAIDGPKYNGVVSDSDSTFETIALLPSCTTNGTFFGLIVALMCCVLVVGLALAFLTRNVPDKFSEGRYVSMSIILMLFFSIMIIPLNYLLDSTTASLSNTGTLLVVRSIGVLFGALAICLTLFVPFFVQLAESLHEKNPVGFGKYGQNQTLASIQVDPPAADEKGSDKDNANRSTLTAGGNGSGTPNGTGVFFGSSNATAAPPRSRVRGWPEIRRSADMDGPGQGFAPKRNGSEGPASPSYANRAHKQKPSTDSIRADRLSKESPKVSSTGEKSSPVPSNVPAIDLSKAKPAERQILLPNGSSEGSHAVTSVSPPAGPSAAAKLVSGSAVSVDLTPPSTSRVPGQPDPTPEA